MGSSASFNKDYQIGLASVVIQEISQPNGHHPSMNDAFTMSLNKNQIFKEIFKQINSESDYMPPVFLDDIIDVLTKYELTEIKSFFEELQPFATSEASRMLRINDKIFTAEIEGIADDDEEFWRDDEIDNEYLEMMNDKCCEEKKMMDNECCEEKRMKDDKCCGHKDKCCDKS